MNARHLLTVAAIVLAGSSTRAEDWPQWRGVDRTGVSKETGLKKSWGQGGPKLLFEAKGAGRGYGTAAVAAGKMYTLGDGLSTAEDRDEYLACFDANNGKQLWKTKTGKAWTSGPESWQSSRCTPTVDGDTIYVVTPYGDLLSLEAATGKILWRKNLKDDFGGKKGDSWGYSESPLVDGDRLVVTPGGADAVMVVLNKKTAETIWKADSNENRGAGHASIVISKVGGIKIYVQTTASGALGVRASDGKVMWTFRFGSTAVIPTPIVRDDLVFCGAGYNTGMALLRQVPTGDGAVKMEEIYGLKGPLNNKHGGIVLVGDYLYGDSNDSGNPYCAELMTGKVLWKGRGSGKRSAAIGAADGHLYIRYQDGVIALVPANPKEYKETGSFKIPGSGPRPSWSHPVIANGRLYLREQDSILCYDIRSTGDPSK